MRNEKQLLSFELSHKPNVGSQYDVGDVYPLADANSGTGQVTNIPGKYSTASSKLLPVLLCLVVFTDDVVLSQQVLCDLIFFFIKVVKLI